MNKIFFYFFLISLLYAPAFSYKSLVLNMKTKNSNNNYYNKKFIKRRLIFNTAAYSPLLTLNKVNAEVDSKELDKLKKEAERIQEIFDIQKEQFNNLPSLKSDNLNNTFFDIIDTFKQDGRKGVVKLMDNMTPTNQLYGKTEKDIYNMLHDTKYNILLNNFDNYSIVDIVKVDDKIYDYEIKLKAPYQKFLYSGLQFTDISDKLDENNMAYILMRWTMIETSKNNWKCDGCYVITQPPSS